MKQLQEAFDALLPTDAQEEKMLREILIARDGAPRRRMRGNPFRIAMLTAAALALCVVTASAAEALGVSQMIRDYFRQKEQVSVMDKLNLAASGLNTTTPDGWKVTITDLFGDDNRWLMGVTVEAPAGTVLDRSDYQLRLKTEGTPDTLPPKERQSAELQMKYNPEIMDVSFYNYLQHSIWMADQIPDENPKDNKVSFVFDNGLRHYQDGITFDLTFSELMRHEGDTWSERVVKKLDATISNVATHFSSNGYHIAPNVSVNAFGGEAVVSKLTLTPLSISFDLKSEDFFYPWVTFPDAKDSEQFAEALNRLRPTRKEQFQRLHPDIPIEQWDNNDWWTWQNAWELDTPLVLYFKDGTSQELDLFAGTDLQIAETVKDKERKTVSASYQFQTLLDLDTVDYITICDTRITLPVDTVK